MIKQLLYFITGSVIATTSLVAGIKKSNSETNTTLTLDTLKIGSIENGNVLIENIAKLQAGNIVSFVIPNGKKVTGRVTKSVINNEQIRIVGIFINEKEAGFGFVFNIDGSVGGTLVFRDTKELYRLRFNEKTSTFYFLKDIYKNDEEDIS